MRGGRSRHFNLWYNSGVKNKSDENLGERKEKLPLVKGFTALDDVKAVIAQADMERSAFRD